MQSSTIRPSTKSLGAKKSALSMGKGILVKIGVGVATFGNLLVGPTMSERDRFLHAVAETRLQTQKGLTAGWIQYQSRNVR